MIYKFFVFFVIFHVAAGEKTREEVTEKCAAKSGISAEEAEKLWLLGSPEENLDRYKCFYKCLLLEFEMIDSNGKINSKKAEELNLEQIKSCAYNKTTDVCLRAYEIFKCLSAAPDVKPTGPRFNVTARCYDELGSSLDEFNEFISAEEIGETDNQKIKCFFKCLYLKFEWMNEDGDFINKDMIYKARNVETESDKAALDHCLSVTGKDTCEKSLNFFRCYQPKKQ